MTSSVVKWKRFVIFKISIKHIIYTISQLRKDNDRIQSALQDALNVRMAKEGEVSVLRKNMEKVIVRTR